MNVYIFTNKGWKNVDEVLTPITQNVKKDTNYTPIEENNELTEKFQKELPFVVTRQGYYYVQSVH